MTRWNESAATVGHLVAHQQHQVSHWARWCQLSAKKTDHEHLNTFLLIGRSIVVHYQMLVFDDNNKSCSYEAIICMIYCM